MLDLGPVFVKALAVPPSNRTSQDLQILYYTLSGIEALQSLSDATLKTLCRIVRYGSFPANHVLYSFGKRSAGNNRRPNGCFVLESSEMIVIDYQEGDPQSQQLLQKSLQSQQPQQQQHHHTHQQHQHPSHHLQHHYHHHQQHHHHNHPQSISYSQSSSIATISSAGNVSVTTTTTTSSSTTTTITTTTTTTTTTTSTSATTSAAASTNSDVLAKSYQSFLVEQQQKQHIRSMNLFEESTPRDAVREALEKDPNDRTEEDIEILMEFTQHLKAFTNLIQSVRRALCSVMLFVVVEKAGTVVLNDGEELDSWSVIVNGSVEIAGNSTTQPQQEPSGVTGTPKVLSVGDCFGILPMMNKHHHSGTMRTKCDDCQFVLITQTDYYRIQHQGEENTKKHEEDGRVVMITEMRGTFDAQGARRGHVVIKGTPERLMQQLIEENTLSDPTYVEDFLLTHRAFISSSLSVANQLLDWFQTLAIRDRVARVILLWVNNHFVDFETDTDMMDFLDKFEQRLHAEKMCGQQTLLNIACEAKARVRNVILTRSSRDEPLNFSILGGYERHFGIFVAKVERKTKAEEIGLKRGDQILEVNGHSFQHVTHSRALEILRATTHLSITIKSNLKQFREMLNTPDDSPRPRSTRKVATATTNTHALSMEIAKGNQAIDPNARLSTIDPTGSATGTATPSSYPVTINHLSQPQKELKPNRTFMMTLGTKRRLQKALMKINIIPKNILHIDSEDCLDSAVVTSAAAAAFQSSNDSSFSSLASNIHQSQSNPDLVSICYDDLRSADYPEHVLKIYKADQTFKYLLVHKETTAHEVVMLALREFGITESSSMFSLCEVSVSDGQMIKQKRLPDQLQNLAERIGLSSRYYLKTNGVSETLVSDEMAPELVRESEVHLLHLNAAEVAIQLTLQDFSVFRQIESIEYISDLFELKSKYGTPMLDQFAELVNKEMFWVVTEICSEKNAFRRMKIIKQFIKIARQCKECKNFNSMFAILSGLGHGAVSRLRQTWDKLPSKYQRIFTELEQLMDPSRNMSKYRQLLSSEHVQPPIIPFYPIAKKDLTFIHLGNDTISDNLINFEKLRMIAKEIRNLGNMSNSPYDLLTMLELGGQQTSSAMIALNQLNTAISQHHAQQHGQATVRRRKKTAVAPNPKKMFEESQMVRRVKAYLNNLKVNDDENQLHAMSLEIEAPVSSTLGSSIGSGSQQSMFSNVGSISLPGSASTSRSRRHVSPAPSTTSSTASIASEDRRTAGTVSLSGTKFGAASPQAVRKLLSLAEPGKTRPHQPKQLPAPTLPSMILQPSPIARRNPNAINNYNNYLIQMNNSILTSTSNLSLNSNRSGGAHERCHSDSPLPLPSVSLSAESSSVTSLSNKHKHVSSGSVTSSDSGHSSCASNVSNSESHLAIQSQNHSPYHVANLHQQNYSSQQQQPQPQQIHHNNHQVHHHHQYQQLPSHLHSHSHQHQIQTQHQQATPQQPTYNNYANHSTSCLPSSASSSSKLTQSPKITSTSLANGATINRRSPIITNSVSASILATDQVAKMYQRLGRSYSHEGMTQDCFYPSTQPQPQTAANTSYHHHHQHRHGKNHAGDNTNDGSIDDDDDDDDDNESG